MIVMIWFIYKWGDAEDRFTGLFYRCDPSLELFFLWGMGEGELGGVEIWGKKFERGIQFTGVSWENMLEGPFEKQNSWGM